MHNKILELLKAYNGKNTHILSMSDTSYRKQQNDNIIYEDELAQITKISIVRGNISNISGMEKLTSLIDVDLSFNPISNIEPLGTLTSLDNLYLFNNQISNLEPLRNLTNLTDLRVQSNQISNIEVLRNLVNITYIELSYNQISNIEPLRSLTNLTRLYLSSNKILNLEAIKNLPKLTDLNVNAQYIDIVSTDNKFSVKLIDKEGTPVYIQNERIERKGNTNEYRIKGIQNLYKFYVSITNSENDIIWRISITPNKPKIVLNYKEGNQTVKTEEKEYEPNAENGIAVGTIIENEARTKEYLIVSKNNLTERITENGTYDITVKEIPKLTGNPTAETVKKGSNVVLENLRDNLPGLPRTAILEDIDSNVAGYNTVTPTSNNVRIKIVFDNGTHREATVPIIIDDNLRITINYKDMDKGNILVKPEPKDVVYGNPIILNDMLNYNSKDYVVINKSSIPARIIEHGITYDVFVKETPAEPVKEKTIVRKGQILTPEMIKQNISGVIGDFSISQIPGSSEIDRFNADKTERSETLNVRITYANGTHRDIEVPVEVTDKITVMVVVKAENGRIVKQVEKEVTIGRKLVSEELVDILPEGYMIGNAEDKLVTSENGQKLSVNIVKISKVDIKGKVDFPYNFPEDIELLVELYKDGQKTGKFVKVSSRNSYYEFKNLDETDKYGRKITYTIGIENLKNLEEAGYEAKISETGEIYVLKITNKKIAGKAENDGKLKGKGEKENQSNQRLPYAGINGSDIVKLTVGGLVLVGIGYLVKVYVRR